MAMGCPFAFRLLELFLQEEVGFRPELHVSMEIPEAGGENHVARNTRALQADAAKLRSLGNVTCNCYMSQYG